MSGSEQSATDKKRGRLGSKDYFPTIDQLVQATESEIAAALAKITKRNTECLLRKAISQLKLSKSFQEAQQKTMASIEMKVDALTSDVSTLKSTCRQPESQSVALNSAAPENPHSTAQLFDQQIRIDGIHESKGEYVTQTESDDAQITAFLQHLGEDQAPITRTKKLDPIMQIRYEQEPGLWSSLLFGLPERSFQKDIY